MNKEIVYLSLGSNLGDKEENIKHAMQMIKERAGEIISVSAFFYSAPWGFSSDNGFVNNCVAMTTSLQPLELLNTLQEIEKAVGRTKKSVDGQYADRIIDIDIILWGERVIDLPELKVPHPLMEQRDFVMEPLREVKKD